MRGSGEAPCCPLSVTGVGRAPTEGAPLACLASLRQPKYSEAGQRPPHFLLHMVLRLPAEMQLKQLIF